jgi:hypothetical protein
MLGRTTWKTAMAYGCAILLGIALGPSINRLIGRLQVFDQEPAVARAAAPAAPPVVASSAPDSSDAVFTCTPSFIGAFPTRVHVLCTVAAPPGGIYYFAAPTSDSKNANRVLSIMLTAKALGKNLQIYYDTAGNGSAYGCQTGDCRPINAIEIMNTP